MSQVQ